MEEKVSKLMQTYGDRIINVKEWNHYMHGFNRALQKQDWDLFHKTEQELIAAYSD